MFTHSSTTVNFNSKPTYARLACKWNKVTLCNLEACYLIIKQTKTEKLTQMYTFIYIIYNLLNLTVFNSILNTEDTVHSKLHKSHSQHCLPILPFFSYMQLRRYHYRGSSWNCEGKKCLFAFISVSKFWGISMDTYKTAVPILYWYLYHYYQNN